MSGTLIRVALTGAAGQIAYSLLPHLCNGSVFGSENRVILSLLDIPGTEGVLEGVQMELEDANFAALIGIVTTSNPRLAFDQANYVMLLGGFPRKPGMERKDLLAKNAAIISEHAEALNDVASRDVKVVVVANPANTLAMVAMKAASELSPHNFTALTRLDHNRLKGMLAKKLTEQRGPGKEVVATDIRRVVICGNHSSTQVPSADHAEVRLPETGAWVPVKDVLNDPNWLRQDLITQVQQRGAAVLDARKLSSALSAAASIAAHLHDWIHGTAESDFVSMGVLSTGNSYNVPDDLIFSFPVTCSKGSWSIVEGLSLSPETQALLPKTIDELLDERSHALPPSSHL